MMLFKAIPIDTKLIKKALNAHHLEDLFRLLFQKLALSYNPQLKLLLGKKNCLIGNIIIDFKINLSNTELNDWIKSTGKWVIQEYYNANKNYPFVAVIITKKYIYYFNKNLILINIRKLGKKSLESLFISLLEPISINSEKFAMLFGIDSPFFILFYAKLENYFVKEKRDLTNIFHDWKKYFKIAYPEKEIGKDLFLKHSYLNILLKLMVYKEYLAPDKYSPQGFTTLEILFDFSGFSLLPYRVFRWILDIPDFCNAFLDKIKSVNLEETDVFRTIYPEMIISGIRHRLGEYYTPEDLCRKMVHKIYSIGDLVLDSSCGSGTFLIELYKAIDEKIQVNSNKKPSKEWFQAINNIFGLDINPIAILTARANLLLYLKSKKPWIRHIKNNIFLCNAIDPNSFLNEIQNLIGDLSNTIEDCNILEIIKNMDLIITNPPWLTYKDADKTLKHTMKRIVAEFDIKPDAKNITNIEEASVFLYKVPDLYLRKDGSGKIAFVMPRSLLVSSQNEKVRRFEKFFNIELFEFNDLIFNIECCCMFAHFREINSNQEEIFNKFPIISHYLDVQTLESLNKVYYEPYVYFQCKKNEKYYVKRLIRNDEKHKLLPLYPSDYYNQFIQGADLIPKTLLYLEILNPSNNANISLINPWISPQAKQPWNKGFFKEKEIDSRNIFYATLSRELYPFFISPYPIFLPLDENYQYNPSKLPPFSKKHWNLIKEVYRKETNYDLFEIGINYRNKLCVNKSVRESQRALYKVVFPNAKKLMSAVIEDIQRKIFIDSTLYYFGTADKLEAYYLCGMLNIPDLYKSVKIISDTRHHHKKPLYFYIPKYTNSKEQQEISTLSQNCTHLVKKYMFHSEAKNLFEIHKLIQSNLNKIRHIGLDILNSREGLRIIKEYLLD